MEHRVLLLVAAVVLVSSPSAPARAEGEAVSVDVPVDAGWVRAGMDLKAGQPLHIEASGKVRIESRAAGFGSGAADWDRETGPQGTYAWPRPPKAAEEQLGRDFPLAAMAQGPWPAYGLIARIGEDGAPFAVGARFDGVAVSDGELWLAVNDKHPNDNDGGFRVAITRISRSDEPPAPPPILDPAAARGRPVPQARVFLLYVDGLRGDVLRDLADAGHVPHFKRVFLDGGLWVPEAYTVFPSNTLDANGALFTGLFSDRNGIKSQNQFERVSEAPRKPVARWLPDSWMARFTPSTKVINLLDTYAPENTHAFMRAHGVQTLGSRLQARFRYSTMPIMPLNPPPQWFHRAINTLGPFGIATKLPKRMDDVNAQYAIEDIIGDPDTRAFAVWMPMVDKVSHFSPLGQFGSARRDIVLADRAFGRILDRLREVGWLDRTYFILVSDHGHMGGSEGINRAANLPRDWVYRRLGVNAKVVGRDWVYPGIGADRFIFVDNQGAGQAKFFLPYGDFFAGPWKRNRLHELTRYRIRPNEPPVDLIDSIRHFVPPGAEKGAASPVDLVLVKLDAERVYVQRDPGCAAIIHRQEDGKGRESYRYEPVRDLVQAEDGSVSFASDAIDCDPLGYLADPDLQAAGHGIAWLRQPHSSQEWLSATRHARYPDAVVAMAKFFAWRGGVAALADARDPDLMVTANEGWSFRSDDLQGTDHGYPFADSMRIVFTLAGPNMRRGVWPQPQRIVDVLPTMLQMIGWPYDPEDLDGRALEGIYE